MNALVCLELLAYGSPAGAWYVEIEDWGRKHKPSEPTEGFVYAARKMTKHPARQVVDSGRSWMEGRNVRRV